MADWEALKYALQVEAVIMLSVESPILGKLLG